MTVGSGDYYPVTPGGKVTASLIMAIGILTIAVITAQVAGSFVDQAARARASAEATLPLWKLGGDRIGVPVGANSR